MGQPFILVGDTTTHGGTICEGVYTHTVDRAAMVVTGHSFTCPQCGKKSILIGTSHVRVNGQQRVLHGDKATCGAIAVSKGQSDVRESG